jgi:hypothetical protein
MIRKLLLPAMLVGLLGGCVTAGYSYRDGYYYDQPGVDYRYHDSGYGYPYGYPYGYGYYPYRNSYPYYGHYYNGPYGYPYYYPYYRKPRPPVTGTPPTNPPPPGDDDDHNAPPWHDYNRRRRMNEVMGSALRNQGTTPQPSQPTSSAPARNEPRAEGSRMRQVMQRAQENRRRQSGETQEQP